MATKPAFREAYKKRRCLVLADGFYEWQKVAGGKQPVYIRLREGSQFAFGGLRERWHDAERRVDSFTIITVEPNELCAKIHDRMPLILPEADFAAWLDSNASGEQLTALLKPYRAAEMESFPVSKLVNSPGNDSAECVKPIETLTRRAPAEERDLFSWNRSWLDCIRHVTKPSEAVGVAPSRTPQALDFALKIFPCAPMLLAAVETHSIMKTWNTRLIIRALAPWIALLLVGCEARDSFLRHHHVGDVYQVAGNLCVIGNALRDEELESFDNLQKHAEISNQRFEKLPLGTEVKIASIEKRTQSSWNTGRYSYYVVFVNVLGDGHEGARYDASHLMRKEHSAKVGDGANLVTLKLVSTMKESE